MDSAISRFHWSRGVIAMTCGCLMLLTATVLIFYFTVGTVVGSCVMLIMVLTVCACAAFAPLSLRVDGNVLILKRVCGQIELPLSDVRSVEVVSPKLVTTSLRTFGSGGMFGHYGYFCNRKTGNFVMYATELSNLLMIRMVNKTYIFSCRDQRLIDKLCHNAQK